MSDAPELRDIGNALKRLPDAQERRRYALLQAAAVLMARAMHVGKEDVLVEGCVQGAELLLAEIEKREKAKQS